MIIFLTLTTTLCAIAISCAYFYTKRTYSYWQRKGIPFVVPRIPFGNLDGKQQFHRQIDQLYQTLKRQGPLAGMYFFNQPWAIALNLDLVKQILIKDFANFQDRGMYHNERDDPLSAHLVSLNGERWKTLRTKLSPTFSSGKMKFMFPTMIEVANQFEMCIAELLRDSAEIEMKELLARFTTDIIGTCAFGIECNSLADPSVVFRQMGKKAVEESRHPTLVQFLLHSNQKLAKRFRVKLIKDDVSEFFSKTVRETIEYREANSVQRSDFMDILINLKNQTKGALTVHEIAAQTFLFFQAGFETSVTTMTFALYELAGHPDVQDRLRRDIRATLDRHQGNLTYESMMDMQYLDQVINETLRKHPPIGSLMRQVTSDYIVPGTECTLPKGSKVIIPVYSFQNDEEYFPDPSQFSPDRFSPDKCAERHPMAYLAFGDGPRNCVGMQFGMMQTRVGLITMLLNYEFGKCERTADPLSYVKDIFMLKPEGCVWLTVKKVVEQPVVPSSIPVLINRSTYKKYDYFEI